MEKASAWTNKYKYISTENIIENSNIFDEDRYTKEYMNIYGIENVRGGSYVTIKLDNNQKSLLQKEIWNASDLCMRCGRNSHFVKYCYATTDIYNQQIKNEENKQNTMNDNLCSIINIIPYVFQNIYSVFKNIYSVLISTEKQNIINISCTRCGRNSHNLKNCFAKTNIHNKQIS